MARYAPAAVIVNDRGKVIYIHGRTGAYLEPAPGLPTHQVLDMARDGLRHELATLLPQAVGTEQEVVRRGVKVSANGDESFTTIPGEEAERTVGHSRAAAHHV